MTFTSLSRWRGLFARAVREAVIYCEKHRVTKEGFIENFERAREMYRSDKTIQEPEKPKKKMTKATKIAAQYSHGTTKEHCSLCKHFQPPTSCAKVSGAISPQGWSKFFSRK